MPSARNQTKRQKKTKERTGGNPAAPTQPQWAKMRPYGSFIVTDDHGQEVVFRLGDTATVLPDRTKVGAQLPIHKYWVVKITDIRGKQILATKSRGLQEKEKSTEYWIQIRWFYSPTEVSYRISGFQASHCSKYERIFSDHTELVSPFTFNELASVVKFREDDPHQHPIPSDQFFTRYFLETSSKQCEISNYVSDTSRSSMGCICGRPYNVNESELIHVMHMCPRPNSLPILMNLRRFPSKSSKHAALLPPDLLRLAAQPIVRGAALPNLGLAGNCRDVTYARRMVYAAMLGAAVPDTWADCVDLPAAIIEPHLPILVLDETGEELVFTCPTCLGPI
ncbi:hypothetical protein C8R46DRAFT_1074131 [Mycena filopes]|nr:hypothetical protein C8R46DRAFT_1074131 [Mycena filopes]